MKCLRLILIFGAVLLFGGIAVYLMRPAEPRFQGKTLTAWLRKFDSDKGAKGADDLDAPQTVDSVRAIRGIGTNGIPTLLKLIGAEDSSTIIHANRFAWRLGWKKFHIHEVEEKRRWAANGFWILRQAAKPAASGLIQIALTGARDSRIVALECLAAIKPDKDITLPALIQLLSDSDKKIALSSAQKIVFLYPEEAEKAGVYKLFPRWKPSSINGQSTNAPVAN